MCSRCEQRGARAQVPDKALGKMVASFTQLAGIIILALPITVIGTNFANQYEQQRFERMAERACCVDGARRLQGDVDLGKLYIKKR